MLEVFILVLITFVFLSKIPVLTSFILGLYVAIYKVHSCFVLVSIGRDATSTICASFCVSISEIYILVADTDLTFLFCNYAIKKLSL